MNQHKNETVYGVVGCFSGDCASDTQAPEVRTTMRCSIFVLSPLNLCAKHVNKIKKISLNAECD